MATRPTRHPAHQAALEQMEVERRVRQQRAADAELPELRLETEMGDGALRVVTERSSCCAPYATLVLWSTPRPHAFEVYGRGGFTPEEARANHAAVVAEVEAKHAAHLAGISPFG